MRAGDGKAVLLPVAIEGGEAVTLAVRLLFGVDGEVRRLVLPPAGFQEPREMAARRLVARLDAELARPGAPGLLAVVRELELLQLLAEGVTDMEARHGPVVARAARLGAT